MQFLYGEDGLDVTQVRCTHLCVCVLVGVGVGVRGSVGARMCFGGGEK